MSTKNHRLEVLNRTILIFAWGLFFSAIMFVNANCFIEKVTLSKWYAFIAGSMLLSIPVLINKRRAARMDKLSIYIILFISYLIIRGLISHAPTIKILILLSSLLFYFFVRFSDCNKRHVGIVIACMCLFQAIYGLMQFLELSSSHGIFKIVGSYDNPAGFAASLAAGFPICFSLCSSRNKVIRFMGIISCITITIGLFLSESRAGIITIFASTMVFGWFRYNAQILKYKRRVLFGGLTFILLLIPLLFFFKTDSALGRLLVWRNSVEMIKDAPIVGSGADSFLAKYMVYQNQYFDKHPESIFSQLADNVLHPFNEYLLLTIEYGLIGLLSFGIIIALVIKSGRKYMIEKLMLLSIATFACFSYPLRYAFVVAILVYCAANINYGKSFQLKCGYAAKAAMLSIFFLCAILLYRDITFEYDWGKVAKKNSYYAGEMPLNDYVLLHNSWNGNPMFFYNYGVLLHNMKLYDYSNEIMGKCALYFNDYDVQMVMAENHLMLNNYNEANAHFMHAHKMIPNRFIPLYRLMNLNDSIGEHNQARLLAKKIIEKPVKIHSPTISLIKLKARKRIENSQY